MSHEWPQAEVESLFALPCPLLMQRAQPAQQQWHDATQVQMSTLLSIKTGACPEDGAYCPQSVRDRAKVRLSAGRETIGDELQALALLAGANSIFCGEKLLTTCNPDVAHDRALLMRRGMRPEQPLAAATSVATLASAATA